MVSDRLSGRKKLVLAGYTISSVARPLIALAVSPLAVLFIRFADRVGKGIRTSPRDALIADSVDATVRGKAFGFHRSMDHAGAIVGPLIATMLLTWYTTDLRTVFLLSAIPGGAAVLLIIAKARDVVRKTASSGTILGTVPTGQLRRYLVILFIFTLGNSSDAFLLLRAGDLGISLPRIPLLWIFFHVIKMLSSMPFGALSDRIGRRMVILAGWGIYAIAYAGFALATTELHIWLLFGFYGLFYGLTEGVEKALLADISPPAERGGAFGWYNFSIGAGALPASVIFGVIWHQGGAQAAFSVGAVLACLAAILLFLFIPAKGPEQVSQ